MLRWFPIRFKNPGFEWRRQTHVTFFNSIHLSLSLSLYTDRHINQFQISRITNNIPSLLVYLDRCIAPEYKGTHTHRGHINPCSIDEIELGKRVRSGNSESNLYYIEPQLHSYGSLFFDGVLLSFGNICSIALLIILEVIFSMLYICFETYHRNRGGKWLEKTFSSSSIPPLSPSSYLLVLNVKKSEHRDSISSPLPFFSLSYSTSFHNMFHPFIIYNQYIQFSRKYNERWE